MGEGYKKNTDLYKAYEKEKTALTTYYVQKRAEEEAKYAAEVNKWLGSGNDLSARLKALDSSLEAEIAKLKDAAEKAHTKEKDFITAEANLRAKYEQDAKKMIISEHEQRLKNIKEEYEYRAALAQNNLDSGSGTLTDVESFVSNKIMINMHNTDLGQTLESLQNLGSAANGVSGAMGPLASIVLALVEGLMKLENAQKVLGMFGTIVERIISIIGPIVDSILEPLAEYLEAIGDAIGQFLKIWFTLIKVFLMFSKWLWTFKLLTAALNAVSNGLNYFYEKVIVPVCNLIIGAVNAVIGWINNIPGISISKFSRLGQESDAASIALQLFTKVIEEETEKQKYLIEKKYQRLIDSVDSLLRSQLDALESMYTLGLITRSQYEAQAKAKTAKADEDTYNLQKQQQAEEANAQAEAIRKNQELAWILWNWQNNAVHFDVGTPEINKDQFALVHKGETIIPRTFAEGIRSGELTLSGGKKSRASQDNSPVIVNLTVEGSVVTEGKLIDSIYKGIAAGIQQKKYSPLPGASA